MGVGAPMGMDMMAGQTGNESYAHSFTHVPLFTRIQVRCQARIELTSVTIDI